MPATADGGSRAFGILLPVSESGAARILTSSGTLPVDAPRGGVQLGDPSTHRDSEGWSGNALDIEWDVPSRTIRVRTSVSGFPTAFHVQTQNMWGVVSSLSLLGDIGGEWGVDASAILELCRVGYPLDGRTLFGSVHALPAGRVVEIRAGSPPQDQSIWAPETDSEIVSRAEHIDRMAAHFGRAVDRLDTEGGLLSLSGGLDTRAIFAGLATRGRLPACFTVSGPRTSLDSVLARDLCRAYGVPHEVLKLDGDFLEGLWDDAVEASRLTGGVSSLWSAPQVYCYRKLRHSSNPHVVLSGFLGNQVGRGSTEGVSSRHVDPSILSGALRDRAKAPTKGWHRRGRLSDGSFDRRFLIQEENAYASTAAYSVGDAHAIQRTPYSEIDVLSAAVSMPSPPPGQRHWLDPRVGEMFKRFRGVGEESFQRYFITERGGIAARFPINYGWTADGSWSLRGLWLGVRAFSEDVMTVTAQRSRLAAKLQRLSRLDGFATHLYADRWIPHVREPLLDLLASQNVREAGLLDVDQSRRALDTFDRQGRSEVETVIAVMDLALLTQVFGARLT